MNAAKYIADNVGAPYIDIEELARIWAKRERSIRDREDLDRLFARTEYTEMMERVRRDLIAQDHRDFRPRKGVEL